MDISNLNYNFFLCIAFFLPFLIVILVIRTYLCLKRLFWKKKYAGLVSLGFFHPYCNAGGGGERVLWTAIRAIQERYSNAHCIVYTGDNIGAEEIIKKIDVSFNIKLLRPIEFIYIKSRFLVEDKYYPHFTLLLQSIASVILGIEAVFKYVPDIYIDSMGYAWTLPIFRYLGSCRVAAYVHYPTISTDMLDSVSMRKNTVNNKQFISHSSFLSYIKLIYYKLFAVLYGYMGRHSEIIMVNSTWTKNHILELWKKPEHTYIVYPPCDVSEFDKLPLKTCIDKRNCRIISVAQFRPEKDHELQIKAFHSFLNKTIKTDQSAFLVLIGSCRHDEDCKRVDRLRRLCSELSISENVEFKINLSFQDILAEMKNANVALHTMWNEHFGIGVVECMSAGLITVAHASGGPKMDIVNDNAVKRTGFLAYDVDSYADALERIWKMESEELLEIQRNARESVLRFSVSKFEESFISAIKVLFT